jgi:hypothetical protein
MDQDKPAGDNGAGDNDKGTAVVADDWEETLKRVGDKQSDNELRARQYNAAIAGLIGIAPQDEIEGMIAAQLIATHNATMECYRRAMIGEQTLEGRRENLNQANKLSRTCATLIEALNRHRGKGGQQKVTVEHVDVHAGGQAVVGVVERPGGRGSANFRCRRAGVGRGLPGGRGSADFRGSTPCKTNCPCTSAGGVERGQGAAAVAGQRRCRTAAAECTAGCLRAPQRVTRMPSSTDSMRLKQSPAGARLRSCCGMRRLL